MNIRLFNDNAGETYTEIGNTWGDLTGNYVSALIDKAVKENISLRDLELLICEEVAVRCAEAKIRKAMAFRKAERDAKKSISGTANCPSNPE